MSWSDAVPNLLIGLREGLEAGLVVSILLAAVRKTAPAGRRVSTAPVWLGVLGAVMVAGSFAAVLTYSTDVLSSRAQQAVGGLLSVLAVVLVTAMVFWMRRTAAGLAAHLRGEVVRAAAIGAGALAVTAFLAVGREGLETTLFLWTAVKASGQTAAPLVGAGLGLAAAVVLCWLLFRQAVRLNLGVFFSRTAIALVIIAAGVLAYGLGDLQDAGMLPGIHWVAFDLTAHIDPNSWWVSIVSGATELTPKMTVLQVVAWVAYLAVVVPLFVRAGRTTGPAEERQGAAAPATTPVPVPVGLASAGLAPAPTGGLAAAGIPAASPSAGGPAPGGAAPGGLNGGNATPGLTPPGSGAAPPATGAGGVPAGPSDPAAPGWWERVAGRRPWATAAVLVVVPVAAAAATIAALPSGATGNLTTVTVTQSSCAHDWTAGHTGEQTFAVDNRSPKAGEVNLLDVSGNVVAELETIGPATTADMTATLAPGTYSFRCLLSGQAAIRSAPVQVSGAAVAAAPAAVRPVTVHDLAGPNEAYQDYAAADLVTLAHDVAAVRADLEAGDLAAARVDWLTAQLDWERVGASYNSFGDYGVAIDGLPDGLEGGVDDPNFTGLHRLEYGLWHGQTAAALLPVVLATQADITTLQQHLRSDDVAGDPTNLPIRAHEILEDAIRDHLSGIDDLGAGAAYPETYADLQVTRVVLGELAPLITERAPTLLPTVDAQMDALEHALLATQVDGQWQPPSAVPLAARQQVNAATGSLLETLSSVPNLLEVPPSH